MSIAVLVAKHFIGLRPKGFQVSHKNEICSDDRVINLCYETPIQNSNRPLHKKRLSYSASIGKSGYKGVWLRVNGKYSVRIIHNQQVIHLGVYDDPKEAARVFDAKAEELHCESIVTNKSLGLL